MDRQVLLQGVVDQFEELIGRFGEHAVAAGGEVYIQPCVYLSLHLAQMRAAGWEELDFDQVAAVSGASALFAYQPGTFMPKYANLYIGMDERIAEATGFGYEWTAFDGADGAWALLKESTDNSRAAKGWHWENVLFAGYRDAANPPDRKVFAMADGPDTFAKWWTWDEFREWVALVQGWGCPRLGRHTEGFRARPPRDVALRVMGDLVEWSTDPPAAVRDKYPEATFGLSGIEAYAADCANTGEHGDWLACHDVNPQWALRNSTAVYLTAVADASVFDEEVSTHLLAAAQEYRGAYESWRELYKQLGHQAPRNAGRTRARRLAGAKAVGRALQHERAGVGQLREALTVAGVAL